MPAAGAPEYRKSAGIRPPRSSLGRVMSARAPGVGRFSVRDGPYAGGRRRGGRGFELIDGLTEFLPGGRDGAWIASPVGPVGADGARNLHSQISPAEILQDLYVVIILDT